LEGGEKMVKINIVLRGASKTEVFTKAYEFVDDGYIVEGMNTDENGFAVVSLSKNDGEVDPQRIEDPGMLADK
jgi:hypothetical protein